MSTIQERSISARDYMEMTAWEHAAKMYMQCINEYDTWQKNYPWSNVKQDKGRIYYNLALCFTRLRCYPDAITAAEEACTLMPKNSKVCSLTGSH